MFYSNDSHIHVGQYVAQYTSPKALIDFLTEVGVKRFAVSSTSICGGVYNKSLREIYRLVKLGKGRVLPVLWVLPQMFDDGGIDKLLNIGIRWRCLKIHPQIHPNQWRNNDLQRKAAELADYMHVPLLIHTGNMEGCYPLLYEHIISQYPSVTFVLAHGRPLEQTVQLMKMYHNVWADTAFMPTDNIVKLCQENLADRVLWGTDYPITKWYYPDSDPREYYFELLSKLRQSITEIEYKKITYQNFNKLFQ